MNRSLPSLFLLLGCTEVSISSLDNDPPVPKIFSHRNGDVLLEGYTVQLGGSVSDDASLEEIETTWYIDDEAVCSGPLDPLGNSTCGWQVPTGEEARIRFEATDRHAAKGSVLLDLAIQLTLPPTVAIAEPLPDGRFYNNTPIALIGTADDAEDAPTDLAITWTSDQDGAVPAADTAPAASGAFASTAVLGSGRHELTVTVTDLSGKTATDAVTIDVGGPNHVPTCAITSPEDGVESGEFNEVVFAGLVGDDDIPADRLDVSWQSDGATIGTSVATINGDVLFPYDALPLGQHTITLTVADEVGATCTATILHAVVEPPTAPVVRIDPVDPQNHEDLVCLVDVPAVDPQGDPLTTTFEWTYDGAAFTVGPTDTFLPGDTVPNTYTAPGQVWECRATATDGRTTGSAGFDSVTVVIPTVATVYAGATHTCQLDTGDELTCWGDAGSNRLTLTNGIYTSVALGSAHTCAIDPGGVVRCVGYDGFGQASPPLGAGFVALEAGDSHTCALDVAGDITCWGANDVGQADTSALTGTYVQFSSAFMHDCAVRTDGGMDCWGSGVFGRTTPTPGVQWSHVAAGDWHTCGLDLTGLAVCFGKNLYGESTPPGGTFTELAAGLDLTCGLRGTGAIECWGRDTGVGEAMEPPAGVFTDVSMGDGYACAVDTLGAVTCWGDNTAGQCDAPLTWW